MDVAAIRRFQNAASYTFSPGSHTLTFVSCSIDQGAPRQEASLDHPSEAMKAIK